MTLLYTVMNKNGLSWFCLFMEPGFPAEVCHDRSESGHSKREMNTYLRFSQLMIIFPMQFQRILVHLGGKESEY